MKYRVLLCVALASLTCARQSDGQPTKRDYPFVELEGTVEEFRFIRNWRHYYWRQDFTMLVRDGDGKLHRVISREPTPWAGYRLGTTFTGLKVDWSSQPRVQLVGVRAIDRIPEDFYDVKLDEKETITAFILRAWAPEKKQWEDFYVNNWFHRWGDDTDRKVLPHFARPEPRYTIYGYLSGMFAPLADDSKKLLAQIPDANIYHGQIVAAKNDIGYEVKLLHVLGRNKKTARYEIFHGNPDDVPRLEGTPPPEATKKKK